MSHPRNGVLLVTTPADWRPQSIHHIPPTILGARVFARKLSIVKAATIVDAFNADAMRRRETGQWALLIAGTSRWDRYVTHAHVAELAADANPAEAAIAGKDGAA
jgi:hypothetical protein